MPNIPAQALIEACFRGDAAAVSTLLPVGGTRLNLSGPRFQVPATKGTPLMIASQGGHTVIVRMMLERAPNNAVTFVNAQGYTAVMYAAGYHHADIVRLLVAHGASVHFSRSRGQEVEGGSPLRLVFGKMPPDAPPRDPDPDGARQVATVRALLQLGAAPDPVADVDGMTPLCLACSYGPDQAAVALLNGGANIDFATLSRHDAPGFTPLMYAAMKNHTAIVKMLLNRGADGTKTSSHAWAGIAAGSTALEIKRIQSDMYTVDFAASLRSIGQGDVNLVTDIAETMALLRMRCCSMCGMTSAGLSATTPGVAQRLKRCVNCPARGDGAHYCGKECQRASAREAQGGMR